MDLFSVNPIICGLYDIAWFVWKGIHFQNAFFIARKNCITIVELIRYKKIVLFTGLQTYLFVIPFSGLFIIIPLLSIDMAHHTVSTFSLLIQV